MDILFLIMGVLALLAIFVLLIYHIVFEVDEDYCDICGFTYEFCQCEEGKYVRFDWD